MDGILVIGAGPAGSASAWKLAENGVPCVLADRAPFPRSKVCGGVLSGFACEILTESGMVSQDEIEDLTLVKRSVMTITADYRELRTFRGDVPPVRLVNRTEFDAFLRRRALEAGAEPVTDSFRGFAGDSAVFSSGREIPFSRMVGADGASSRVRRCIPRGRFSRPSPALSTVVHLSEKAMESLADRGLHIFFFSKFTGYGWVFPRKDDVIAGIGSFGGPGASMHDLLGKMLMHAGLGRGSEYRGALLPAGGQPVHTGSGRVLLAGDAAGLCDRVSGEGISLALESGMAAAEAILTGTDSWGKGSRCLRTVRDSSRFRNLLYRRPFRDLAMGALARSDRWYRKYWEIICGKSDYAALLKG